MRFLMMLVLVILAGCEAQGGSAGSPEVSAETNQLMVEANAALAAADAALADAGTTVEKATSGPATKWEYSTSSDPMDDKPTELACVWSSNEVNLPSPYEPTRARLCLRNSPQYGRDVYVALEKNGQILCRSYEECTVRVRFDKAPKQNFSAIGPSDGSTDMFFITNRSRFESAMKNADVTAIQAEFYQAGNQAMLFDTKGLVWPKK